MAIDRDDLALLARIEAAPACRAQERRRDFHWIVSADFWRPTEDDVLPADGVRRLIEGGYLTLTIAPVPGLRAGRLKAAVSEKGRLALARKSQANHGRTLKGRL